MKKNKLVTVLIVVLTVLILICAGILGYLWYRHTHVFVENKAYPVSSEFLDLREEDISFDHYNELHGLLPGCQILWNVPFQNGRVSSDAADVSVADLTEQDISLLLQYLPNVRRVDASACTNYGMLELLKAQLPQDAQVLYSVSLGGKSYAPDTAELVLEKGDYDFELLKQNLIYLPNAVNIQFKSPDLTIDQIDELREVFTERTIRCTVEILGKEYDDDTTEIDLSALVPGEILNVSEQLVKLPKLEKIGLMNADGKSNLEKADVKALADAVPNVLFDYSFDFYGTTVNTTTEEVRIANKRIGDEGESEVRLALDLMRGCKRLVLENVQMSNDVLKQIRDDYRDQTKVVWRVYFGTGSTLTDAEVIRAVYDLVDNNSHNLIYCEDVRYMDIGHDEYLDTCDFVAGMPNLEVIIISGSPIKDLSPFANCKKLRVLEAANCGYITDLTPLAQCESLEMLNICYTKVTDLTPLDDLKLTNLHARGLYRTLIPEEQQKHFIEKHPDCLTSFIVNDQPYGIGWRYVAENETMEWYKDIQKAFRYPDPPNHVGWYLNK